MNIKFDSFYVGSHPLVVRFMKGVFNSRPTSPRTCKTWEVSHVLNYLKTLTPAKYLSLKDLTLKLTMLIALTNAARVQTLHQLSCNILEKTKDGIVLHINGLLKQSRPGYHFSSLKLKAYPPDRRLCVLTYYKEYMKRTKIHRNKSVSLLLSFVKPFKPVTKDTISRWIKTVMERSGIDTKIYTSHSVRAASTSKAKACMVPITDIMKVAGWSQESTFTRFYHKQTETPSFADAVLQDTAQK
jgi:hypothetical protein